ncbi:MAG: MATE family efflux transporter [Planctomycetaceae bacterium]|nr:MATE family efflux transporter [Planctomycetaceae bacterium]
MQLSFVIAGIFVGRYLGAEPLAALNLALPLIQVYVACGAFFGIGGTVLVAMHKGENQDQKCSEIFTLSLLGMLAAGLLFMGLGLGFQDELIALLSGNEPVFYEHLAAYLFPLFLASPMFILTLGMVYHIRTDGKPVLASGLLLTANILNLILIPVFIHLIGNLSACAWAMFVGYGCSTLGLYAYFRAPSRTLQWRFSLWLLRDFWSLTKNGFPVAAAGLLSPIMIFCVNRLVMQHGGPDGLVVYSVIMSSILIISLFIAGTAQTMMPMIGVLYGEKDWKGLRFVFQLSLATVSFCAVLLILFLESFPAFLLGLFGITQPNILEIGCFSLRLFAPAIGGIALSSLMRAYSQATGRPMLALAIVFVENIGAMLPVLWIASLCFGYYGIWGGYVLAAYLTALVYVIYYVYNTRYSAGGTRGFLLLPVGKNGQLGLFDATISVKNADDLTKLVSGMRDFAGQRNLSADFTERLLRLTERAVAAVFAAPNIKKPANRIDLMIEIGQDGAMIHLRFNGSPLDILPLIDVPAADAESALHLGLNNCRLRIFNQ